MDLSGLQEAQQLDLQRGRQLTDLVEKQGPVAGGFDGSPVVAVGAGEGALAVAEELTFEQVFGDRSAVYGHEGAVGIGAETVQRAGDEFLAGACLAANQHRNGQRRYPGDRVVDVDDGGVVADDHRFRARIETVMARLGRVKGRPDSSHERLDSKRLGQIVEHAQPTRRGGGLDGAVGRHQDELGLRRVRPAVLEQLETGTVPEVDAGDDDIETDRDGVERAPGGRGGGADVEALHAEGQLHYLAHTAVSSSTTRTFDLFVTRQSPSRMTAD